MSFRQLVGAAALILFVAACTDAGAGPTAFTSSSQPRPTTTAVATTTHRATTSTTDDDEHASLFRVNPVSLEPLPGFDPIPAGDTIWAASSPNGRWMALVTGHDSPNSRDLRLIDMANWEVVTDLHHPWYDVHLMTDDGVAYWLEGSRLKGIRAGGASVETIGINLPATFIARQVHFRSETQIAIFGTNQLNQRGDQLVELVTVDLTSGERTLIELPDIPFGSIGEVTAGEYTFFIPITPVIVWDQARDRALVVHGDGESVTEVGLADGTVRKHAIGAAASPMGRLLAWLAPPARAKGPNLGTDVYAELSRDGRFLYVAVQRGDIVLDEYTNWTVTSTATGLKKIETETWQVVGRLDAPISQIALSPDGAHLLGTGSTAAETNTSYEYHSSGLFVIETRSLEMVEQIEPFATDQFHGGFSFSQDSRYGYAETVIVDRTRIDVIDLASGQILTTREGDVIHIVGELGLLGVADHTP
jgi:hypothetical protein